MRITEAAAAGIERIRLPQWAVAYIRVHPINGGVGPCVELWERSTQEVIGVPTPQILVVTEVDSDAYEPYDGPLDPSDKS